MIAPKDKTRKGKASPVARSPRSLRGVIWPIGGILAIIVGAAVYMMPDERVGSTDEPKRRGYIAESKPILLTNDVERSSEQQTGNTDEKDTIVDDGSQWRSYNLPWLEGGHLEKMYTNGIDQIVEIIRTPDGKKHELIRPRDEEELFVGVDQLLLMAQDLINGGPPLPIPSGNMDKDFYDAIDNHPIKINQTDTAELKQLKEDLITMRSEVLDAIKEGDTSFEKILSEHEDAVNEDRHVRRDLQKELNELVAQGDLDAAEEFYEKMNKALEQMGFSPLRMPLTEEEKLLKREDKVYNREIRRNRKDQDL